MGAAITLLVSMIQLAFNKFRPHQADKLISCSTFGHSLLAQHLTISDTATSWSWKQKWKKGSRNNRKLVCSCHDLWMYLSIHDFARCSFAKTITEAESLQRALQVVLEGAANKMQWCDYKQAHGISLGTQVTQEQLKMRREASLWVAIALKEVVVTETTISASLNCRDIKYSNSINNNSNLSDSSIALWGYICIQIAWLEFEIRARRFILNCSANTQLLTSLAAKFSRCSLVGWSL